ncbi:MAG: hypothetical protein K8S98_10585 [Planctomycetes bacterium]|nr:hypothetical protein [Planctomycetota bacterium]
MSAASGIALVWIRLFCDPADEFSTVRHPAEAWILLAHRWSAPLAIAAIGWTVGDHAAVQLQRAVSEKATGVPVLVLLGAVIASGTALQTLDLGNARTAFTWLHVGLNTATAVVIVAHVLAARRRTTR